VLLHGSGRFASKTAVAGVGFVFALRVLESPHHAVFTLTEFHFVVGSLEQRARFKSGFLFGQQHFHLLSVSFSGGAGLCFHGRRIPDSRAAFFRLPGGGNSYGRFSVNYYAKQDAFASDFAFGLPNRKKIVFALKELAERPISRLNREVIISEQEGILWKLMR
jgi:hypothetical protein